MGTLKTMTELAGKRITDKEVMVFDWDKAAEIIKKRKPTYAAAGLRQDWENTGGLIYKQGQPIFDKYTYLASTWAFPELEIDGETIACYRIMNDFSDWNAKTKWPKSALTILKGEKATK